jgi:hypothetical protein
MGLFKPDPPSPPNPLDTARAATGTNVATAVANQQMSSINQVTPDGSLTYANTGSYAFTDPTTGQTYNIPIQTAYQTLSPSQQAIKGQYEGAQFNTAGMANSLSGKIAQHLSQPMNFSGAPAAGNASNITGIPAAETSFNGGGPIQDTFGQPAGQIKTSYAPEGNYSQDRQRVEDSLMARMNPQLALERSSIEQRLADQGIRYGSAAYKNAMDDYNRQANDARFAAIGQAGSEQARMNSMAGQEAAFQNSAQQQGYEQELGRGSFANAAQGQEFSQNAAQATFRNAGLAQQLGQQQAGFNAAQAGRNAWMNEQYAQRNQPIQEIGALMSGGQVTSPNFVNTPSTQIATTDVGGLINQNFAQQMGNYQAQNQNWQSMMGGILGLGGAAIKASDERIKKNVDRVGTVFAFDEEAERRKLPVYEYQYKNDPTSTRHVGPMAQDIEKLDRSAVREIGGVKHIDTRKVMGNILRAA